MQKQKITLRWLLCTALPKLPIFLLALPFVLVMRIIRPILWIRLVPVREKIGHGIADTDFYLLERRAGLDPSNAVDIFYPDRPWKGNRQMIKMWKRLIPLYDLVYWVAWANRKIRGFEPYHYTHPHPARDIHALSNDAVPLVSFNTQEEGRGRALLSAMGIPPGGQIICFNARDNAYLKAAMPHEDWGYHDYRDVDINTYTLAIKELVARGYYCIRMGRVVNQPFLWKHPRVIDYAMSSWKCDFADMYLISKCHFFIGGSCGLDSVSWLFRKPWMALNMIPMGHAPAWSFNYSFIFKKIWMARENRFLRFKEILSSDIGMYAFSQQYKKSGFEIVDNTPEEILDAVIEKEERTRGCWQTHEEDENLQRRFWSLWQPNALNRVFRARVGSKFLSQNRLLLEENI